MDQRDWQYRPVTVGPQCTSPRPGGMTKRLSIQSVQRPHGCTGRFPPRTSSPTSGSSPMDEPKLLKEFEEFVYFLFKSMKRRVLSPFHASGKHKVPQDKLSLPFIAASIPSTRNFFFKAQMIPPKIFFFF